MIVRKLLIIVRYQFYHNLTNFRKINLLPHHYFIEKNNLHCENQFDFRKNSSTVLAINSIYDKFINNIDQNLYTCCLFLDLSKAFDTVDHHILLDKLYRNFGIRGKPLDLLTSYLKNRYQYTIVRKFMSSLNQCIMWGTPGILPSAATFFVIH